MRIKRVQIDNFRNLKHIDVQLGNIVALIGENNSGKSNFLRAIALPLSSDDPGSSKRLTWYDINTEAKRHYYEFITANKVSIVNGTLSVDEFIPFIPVVSICLTFQPDQNEHYNVKDILIDEKEWLGGILYQFRIKSPEELLGRIRVILEGETNESDIHMSLLPIELYDYCITNPIKGNSVSYDSLSKFRTVDLPAERDSFASSADRLGSKALSDLLKKGMTPESQVKIEKAYGEFFNTVKVEGKLDTILNWQEYSGIEGAQRFFQQISILPNMPQMSSILGSIRLGYDDESMFMQGLGHRNLILMTVLLNSYINKERDISYRLMTVEEPEAHLCIGNVLLMASLFNAFSQMNRYTQIVYSTHNAELVNKVGLDKVIVFHNGEAFSLKEELTDSERDYLAANPNTDIFKLLYSRRTILVEGITEELLIKSYIQTSRGLSDIKVLSFHKGYTKIIDIWKRVNSTSGNKLGVVRDFDNQPGAKEEHDARQDASVIIRTTKQSTLEPEIVSTGNNFALIRDRYGSEYGWTEMSAEELATSWQKKKSNVMLRICHDLVNGVIDSFSLPSHIQDIIDFMMVEGTHEN